MAFMINILVCIDIFYKVSLIWSSIEKQPSTGKSKLYFDIPLFPN